MLSDKAKEDLQYLKRPEPTAYKKARLLIEELSEHPKTGRGKPQLKIIILQGYMPERSQLSTDYYIR
tara:strand:+ start:41 stop:241 length:201 start_codon:yes stop_codon:yes gene_type:complete